MHACVIADPRGGDTANPLIAGKKVVLVVARGGSYKAGTPRAGWDHLTPWLSNILGGTFGADLTVVDREWTLVGVNPALNAFKEQAVEVHTQARSAAREAGRALGVPANA